MSAKEYLRQLEVLNTKINQKIQEAEDLRLIAEGTGSLALNPNKVQTSIARDKLSETVCRYVDLEHKIDSMIDSFVDQKDMIINQIQSLQCGDNTNKYINVLYKRYVEFKSLEKISVEMNYEYKWTCKIHGYALKEFDEQVLKNTNKHD